MFWTVSSRHLPKADAVQKQDQKKTIWSSHMAVKGQGPTCCFANGGLGWPESIRRRPWRAHILSRLGSEVWFLVLFGRLFFIDCFFCKGHNKSIRITYHINIDCVYWIYIYMIYIYMYTYSMYASEAMTISSLDVISIIIDAAPKTAIRHLPGDFLLSRPRLGKKLIIPCLSGLDYEISGFCSAVLEAPWKPLCRCLSQI